ncbi:type II toxin-antitoxin system HipA family toxin [Patulibacter medicamentivorans]|uniref:type II toxin-antitoxin system HipA family toxin n=1 Tax=Patulibacter medicamentivorans TaxID=1097667 RepID=UPI0002DAF00A|nr:HipA domain-containing protein [Patulibacter medicamentivorans]
MTSESLDRAFVWSWPPRASEPLVAGVVEQRGDRITFAYGQSYRGGEVALPLYLPELPVRQGVIDPLPGLRVAGCIADAGPDGWGQRVILNRLSRARVTDDPGRLSLLTYLLESGSDRSGALDFQRSATDYVPRRSDSASLDELVEAADRVERGVALSPALDRALLHGSSIGGARPKALLEDGGRRLIAKFSSNGDTYPVVKAEFVAMELARRAGLDVARVQLTRGLGRDVLLVERFDRVGGEAIRRPMVSALTILALDELAARYASYADLAVQVRERFSEPERTLHELFARITFNVLIGNTDDHARNHAAFWDPVAELLTLTPAYDICPMLRGGGEASQAMAIAPDGWRMSQVEGCVATASTYRLSEREAREIVQRQVEVIRSDWVEVCEMAEMGDAERDLLWGRAVLNPYALRST